MWNEIASNNEFSLVQSISPARSEGKNRFQITTAVVANGGGRYVKDFEKNIKDEKCPSAHRVVVAGIDMAERRAAKDAQRYAKQFGFELAS